jgi:hypothetical protein
MIGADPFLEETFASSGGRSARCSRRRRPLPWRRRRSRLPPSWLQGRLADGFRDSTVCGSALGCAPPGGGRMAALPGVLRQGRAAESLKPRRLRRSPIVSGSGRRSHPSDGGAGAGCGRPGLGISLLRLEHLARARRGAERRRGAGRGHQGGRPRAGRWLDGQRFLGRRLSGGRTDSASRRTVPTDPRSLRAVAAVRPFRLADALAVAQEARDVVRSAAAHGR